MSWTARWTGAYLGGEEDEALPIPLTLDYVIARATEERAEDLIRRAAGRPVSRRRALEALPRVLEHKWLLSEQLGRDVGLRVAAVDYFDNFDV